LGTLKGLRRPEAEDLLAIADAARAKAGRPLVRDLDAAERFQPRVHLASDNASTLIYTLSAMDALRLDDGDVVAVVGNSLGWYTALHVAGALPFSDGLRIVEATGGDQATHGVGGQLIHPLTDDAWRPAPELRAALGAALDLGRAQGFAEPSVLLGGAMVVAGDKAGLSAVRGALPRTERSGTAYPLTLAGHSAFHTPLMEGMAERIGATLDDLRWSAPRVSLVDGRGHIWRPRIADAQALRHYTLHTQMLTPYDFAHSVRVALREFAPDALMLLGPGQGLGGALGQILALEGWDGVRCKDDFKRRQAGPSPLVK